MRFPCVAYGVLNQYNGVLNSSFNTNGTGLVFFWLPSFQRKRVHGSSYLSSISTVPPAPIVAKAYTGADAQLEDVVRTMEQVKDSLAVEQARAELLALRPSALEKRARRSGVSEEALEVAKDADRPRGVDTILGSEAGEHRRYKRE